MFTNKQDHFIDQEKFVSIIEKSQASILLLSDHYEVISANNQLIRIFEAKYGLHLSPDINFIKSLEQNYPQIAQQWEKRLDKALMGHQFVEEDAIEIEGKTCYWELHFHSFPLNEIEMGISVFIRDITLRKGFESKIRHNAANMRSILNAVDDSIWLINKRFELIDFNEPFYKNYLIAYGVKLERGKNIIDLIPAQLKELKQIWSNRYESALKGVRGVYFDEYQVGERKMVVEIITYPIRENGRVTGVTIYSRDVTEQKHIENQLKAQNKELSKVNEELDRFVYSASHDLRAPLLSVKGLVNLIRIEPDAQNQEIYLGKICEAVDKLDTFIKDIIDLSSNSRTAVEASPIDFHKVLMDSVETLKYTDEAERVRLEKSIQQTGPFHSDPKRLHIIFNNIISNAVRYQDMRKSDSFLRVTINSFEDKAEIHFIDNGIGIAPEFHEKIFGMFYRANTERTGSGLGLYIVKEAVEMIQGIIEVHSELGKGTHFIIRIKNLA